VRTILRHRPDDLKDTMEDAQKSIESADDAATFRTFCLMHAYLADEKANSELSFEEWAIESQESMKEMGVDENIEALGETIPIE
jgi:hypothetical protein